MHIALFIHHFSADTGGAEAFAVTVARELLVRGHRLSIVAVDGQGLDEAEFIQADVDAAPRTLRDLGADVVVDWGLTVPADLHRLGGGTHREFQRLVLQTMPRPVAWLKRLLYTLSPRHRHTARRERTLLRHPGTHVLAVSEFVEIQVRRTVALPRARLHVLHNGVDSSRFHPADDPAERRAMREEWGLSANDTVFLMVAHNLRLKNIALLDKVFRRCSDDLPGAKLVLMGKRRPRIQADWFVYAGTSSTPEAVYRSADVLLHPTYYDACANVVLEAMASGLAVVSSDRNGSAELIAHGRNGIVLPVVGPKEVIRDQWTDHVRELTLRPERRTELGQQARQLAEQWTIQRYVERLEAILQKVASER